MTHPWVVGNVRKGGVCLGDHRGCWMLPPWMCVDDRLQWGLVMRPTLLVGDGGGMSFILRERVVSWIHAHTKGNKPHTTRRSYHALFIPPPITSPASCCCTNAGGNAPTPIPLLRTRLLGGCGIGGGVSQYIAYCGSLSRCPNKSVNALSCCVTVPITTT